MTEKQNPIKYGYEDHFLCEWLTVISDYSRKTKTSYRGQRINESTDGAFQIEAARLWSKTRVENRYGLTFDETVITIALLYERLANAIGRHAVCAPFILYDNYGSASALLRFHRLMRVDSKLLKHGLVHPPQCNGVGPILAQEAFKEITGYPCSVNGDDEPYYLPEGRSLFEVISPRVNLNDVVLPSKTREAIEDSLYYARHRDYILAETDFNSPFEKGIGTTLLFHGPSGTGKTMAAEAFARALGKEVCVARPEAIENRYMGETEKNIVWLFDTAREEDSVLVFDECDSFFYTRPAGTEYQDVFVGRQINMLLRGIEESEGVIILTTNRADLLDPALERRLAAKIHFPLPDAETRSELWRRMLPSNHGLTDEDVGDVAARYRLTGGEIKQIVLSALRRTRRLNKRVDVSAIEEAIRALRTENRRVGF
jgi:hypothetical protein